MRFPVVVKDGTHPSPAGAIHYELASNGLFQVRSTCLYRAVTRVHGGVPGLMPSWESLELRFPKLPAGLLEELLAFFRDAWERCGGEAMAFLLYHPAGEFRVGVPSQTVGGYLDRAGVFRAVHQLEYGRVALPEGFHRLGTVHSHAGLPAYSSATDCMDERHQDGLHVVFGELHRDEPSRSAAFVANQVRFGVPAEQVLETARMPERPAREDWLSQVRQGGEPSAEIAPAPESGWPVEVVEDDEEESDGPDR